MLEGLALALAFSIILQVIAVAVALGLMRATRMLRAWWAWMLILAALVLASRQVLALPRYFAAQPLVAPGEFLPESIIGMGVAALVTTGLLAAGSRHGSLAEAATPLKGALRASATEAFDTALPRRDVSATSITCATCSSSSSVIVDSW